MTPEQYTSLPADLRFHGRYGSETEEQAATRRRKRNEAAADAIESLRAELAAMRRDAHQLLNLHDADSATDWNVALRNLAASSGYTPPAQEPTP